MNHPILVVEMLHYLRDDRADVLQRDTVALNLWKYPNFEYPMIVYTEALSRVSASHSAAPRVLTKGIL